MEKTEGTTFDSWAIVELMGHNSTAGKVQEVTVAGAQMLRVDVPELDGQPAFTRFFGGGAIYSLTPCSEEAARKFMERARPQPVTEYVPDFRRMEQLEEDNRRLRESLRALPAGDTREARALPDDDDDGPF